MESGKEQYFVNLENYDLVDCCFKAFPVKRSNFKKS